MKKILTSAALCGLIGLVSCQEENKKSIEKDFSFDASTQTAIVGETVTFTDYSINVDSRTWTFPDGSPASSEEAVVDVTFNSAGEKKVNLTVTYADGTEDSGTMTVSVLDPMSAEIAVAGLTERGCAKKGAEIAFSLENVVGGPTSYEWTFPGGTPETSTEASPKVVWNDQINNVEVSCRLTRETDGAAITVTKNIIAGNYPMFTVDSEYNLDVFGFEQGETNKVWYNWGNFPTAVPNDPAGEHPEIMTIADGGANGTAKCMKIDISQCYGDCVWEFAHRNNWPNNPWLTSGEKYELSLWFRADLPAEGTMAGCMWLNIFTFVPDYLNDPLRALKASDSWSAVFDGDEFTVTSQTKLWEGAITTIGGTAEAPEFNGLFTTEWQKYTFEFTVEEGNAGDIFKNCYLAFGLTGVGATVYVDEIQLNLIEE